ncbi:oxidoreductase [Marmoricola endophyticus]|uniref:Pyridine nucleotide-disulfide oxidoreductase domain-containing protein 2 n=1 Tax=Marmoricola endophyticus TaxID=2040280 RepID=A0A917BT53_9ACTN|nr:NAD(P)/FAD-dependent oxidoreductase [Marmoricola endophyticus]GGF57754.1 oxidoreductase [Marmoricola endophyticus]
MDSSYDVIVVGGGHNALTAAAYLSREGLSTLLLERLDHTGGAAVSAEAFSGTGVRLSRYSYLVSVLPDRVVADLGLDLDLRSRGTASYTPVRRGGRDLGLLAERPEGAATAASFREVTGGDTEYTAWQEWYDGVEQLAGVVAPTLTAPLPRARALSPQTDPSIWRDLVERPVGAALRERFADDLVRGVVGTDALIGTFADLEDPSLVQNRCLLYHLIGNGTGEWRVPVGGMGAVTDALAAAAGAGGTEIRTGASVTAVTPDGEVTWVEGGTERRARATHVLSGVAPYVLDGLLGDLAPTGRPAGSQLKINLLLDRLPRLRSGADPAVAFAGTFHVAESAEELRTAYSEAAAGRIPTRPPGELYCHSLTDPSILGPLAGDGVHTLTYFGLHMSAALFETDRERAKQEALGRAIATIDEVLAEPLLDCVRRDRDGRLCIEAKVPQDVEDDLAMPGGHIFHGDLDWPWADDEEPLDTPARRWGVETGLPGVLVCGSGARRGGAVSGLGGHNAAMAVLESR